LPEYGNGSIDEASICDRGHGHARESVHDRVLAVVLVHHEDDLDEEQA